MSPNSLPALIATAALVLFGGLPTVVLAAAPPDVTGTVTLAGAPVAGAAVSVLIEGNDMVWPATTDANGAWSVAAGVAVGQTLSITATTPTTKSLPDAHGCVTFTAESGRSKVVVQALPLGPVAIVLDTPVTSKVCSATATPRATQHARPTLPATDTAAPPSAGAGTGGLLLVLGLGATAWLAVAAAARHPARRD